MTRIVALPFAVLQPGQVDRANLLLGEPLSRHIASILSTGPLEVEFADPLSSTDGNRYLYSRALAARVIPPLAQHLNLDHVLLGELTVTRRTLKLAVVLYTPDAKIAFEWEGEGPPTTVFALVREAAKAVHEALEVEPTLRELEHLEHLPTLDFEALRCFALAHALARSQEPDHVEQRLTLLEHALRIDPRYEDAYVLSARTLLELEKPTRALLLLERGVLEVGSSPKMERHLAEVAIAVGLTDRALEQIAALLERNPFDVEAHRARARAYLEAERFDEAAFALQESVRRLPQSRELRLDLSACLLRLGDASGALEWIDALLRINPSDVAALTHQGQALELLGQPRDAEDAYTRALEHDPDDVLALNNLGCLFLSQALPARALILLDNAARLAPDEPRISANLARAYLELGLDEPAFALIQLLPDHVYSPELVRALLIQCLERGDLTAAHDHLASPHISPAEHTVFSTELALREGLLEDARNLANTHPDAHPHLLARLVHLAREAIATRDLTLAEDALALALHLNPSALQLLIEAAALQLEQERPELAEAWLRAALERDPQHLRAHELLSRALTLTDRVAEARAWLLDAPIEEDARHALLAVTAAAVDDAAAYGRHVHTCLQAGLSPHARRILESSLDHGDDSLSAILLAHVQATSDRSPNTEEAHILFRLGDIEGAGKRVHLALSRNGSDPSAHNLAGLIADREGDTDKARNHWTAALEKDPEQVETLILLGARFLADTQHLEAIELLERAAQIAPHDRQIRGMLQTAVGLIA